MPPFFSIVIPTYNRSVHLSQTIDSILKQSFTDFELIVVDDGSRDNTKEIVTALAKNDDRIRYIYQNNAERAAARNNGYSQASGYYVMFFDSDDFMPQDNLAKMHSLIADNPGYNFYASKFVFKTNEEITNAPVCKLEPGTYGLDLVLKGSVIGTLFTVKRDYKDFKLFPEDRRLAALEDWMCLMYNLKDQKLYLGDFIGCIVNNHEDRSMSQNQAVIQKKLKATEILDHDLSLTSDDRKKLWSFSYYFCAVHAYLDFNRKQALKYIWKSITIGGIHFDFIKVLVTALIGKKIINKIQTNSFKK